MTTEDEDIKRLLTGAVPVLAAPEDRVGAVARRVGRQRRRVLVGSTFALVLAVGLGIGGVRVLAGGSTVAVPTLAGGQRWTSCALEAPEMGERGGFLSVEDTADLPRLAADFTPVAIVVCGNAVQQRAGGGEDLVAVEQRSEDVAAVVAALRMPDEPGTTGPCTADLPAAPWLAVVDAEGRWMRPGIPLSPCRKQRAEFRRAMDALPLTTVATRTIAEITSAEAANSGCSQSWKDVIAIETTSGPGLRSGKPEPFPAGPVRLCVFEVSQEKGDGEFAYGTVLPEDRRVPIEQALLKAGQPEPCNVHASRFALVWSASGADPLTYVELGGCHRIMSTGIGGTVLAQGDAALAALLAKP